MSVLRETPGKEAGWPENVEAFKHADPTTRMQDS